MRWVPQQEGGRGPRRQQPRTWGNHKSGALSGWSQTAPCVTWGTRQRIGSSDVRVGKIKGRISQLLPGATLRSPSVESPLQTHRPRNISMARTYNRTYRPWLFMVLLYTVSIVQSATFARAAAQKRSSAGVPIQDRTLNYLRRTLNALKGALEFFQRQYDKVNLDAVIGTRIVEGSLKVLLANLQRKRLTGALPADVVTSIREIYHVAKRASDDAEPRVYQSQPRYYQRIGPAIREGLWELNYTRRTLPSSVPMWSYRPVEAMTETESDDCLTELFGTTGKTDEKCNISESCWRRMTTLGYNRYSLSHEIFYLQIGEQSGCLPQLLWQIVLHGQRSLPYLQDTFCANMLREALTIAADGYPGPQQDLFMEQAALCGMYGYGEFFRYGWLDTILGWQDKAHGCYSWDGWPEDRIGEHRHHITKREERRLDNGCLCHRTTVAAGALVQYVRFLVEEYVAETTYSQQV